MSSLGALFFLMTGGMFLVLFRVPYRDIGARYYRLITYLCLLGWTVVLATTQPGEGYPSTQYWLVLGLLVTGFLHLLSLYLNHQGLRRTMYWVSVVLILGILLGLGVWPPGAPSQSYYSSSWTLFVQLALTAAILGSIIDAMICGHWYLVNSGLTLRPIRSISRTLTAVLLLKLLVLGLVLVDLRQHAPGRFASLVWGSGALFWVRLLSSPPFGLLLNWMNWKALDVGNTQAATGILYAAIVFIVVGEFFAYFLTLFTGVAL